MKALLLVVLLLLSACAATLEHPVTHQRQPCQAGWWRGGGTGIAGAVLAGIAVVGNIVDAVEYRKCVDTLKRAGYEEVTPAPASPRPEEPSSAARESG